MTRSRKVTIALGVFALLGAVDVLGLVGFAMPDDAPPAAVMIIGAVFGVITLGALKPAATGRRGGLATVVSSRVVSALFGIPVFFANDAPGWAQAAVAVSMALTVVGLALIYAAQRHGSYSAAAA